MTWQSIETAPKDGSRILVYTPDRCEQCLENFTGLAIVFWNDEIKEWCVGKCLTRGHWIGFHHKPTLWSVPEIPE